MILNSAQNYNHLFLDGKLRKLYYVISMMYGLLGGPRKGSRGGFFTVVLLLFIFSGAFLMIGGFLTPSEDFDRTFTGEVNIGGGNNTVENALQLKALYGNISPPPRSTRVPTFSPAPGTPTASITPTRSVTPTRVRTPSPTRQFSPTPILTRPPRRYTATPTVTRPPRPTSTPTRTPTPGAPPIL